MKKKESLDSILLIDGFDNDQQSDNRMLETFAKSKKVHKDYVFLTFNSDHGFARWRVVITKLTILVIAFNDGMPFSSLKKE